MTPLYTISKLIKELYEIHGKQKATAILLLTLGIVAGLGSAIYFIATKGL